MALAVMIDRRSAEDPPAGQDLQIAACDGASVRTFAAIAWCNAALALLSAVIAWFTQERKGRA